MSPVSQPVQSGQPQITATVAVGGKQFRVRPGDTLILDRLANEEGQEAVFDQVHLAEFPDGSVAVGNPVIPNARVTATIDHHPRGEKLRIFKLRRRKNSKRSGGHRQDLTQITIRAIECAPPKSE